MKRYIINFFLWVLLVCVFGILSEYVIKIIPEEIHSLIRLFINTYTSEFIIIYLWGVICGILAFITIGAVNIFIHELKEEN